MTNTEDEYLKPIDDLMKESLDRLLKAEWSEKHEIVLERAILFKFPTIRGLTVSEGKISFYEGSAPEAEVKQFLNDLKNFKL